jgi:hypothetical protein
VLYKTDFVLYGCETRVSQEEKNTLGISEGRVLKRILGPKRAEATGDWTELHN